MRVILSKNSANKLFWRVFGKYNDWKKIAEKLDVCDRTIREWRKCNFSLPYPIFEKLVMLSRLKKHELIFKLVPDFWHINEAGRRGGLAKMLKYGNLGTPEGRRLGGIRSLATHKRLKDKFVAEARPIRIPENNKKLAELLGIFIGDGHLSDYQASIYTNSVTDLEHAIFVQKLIEYLFGIFVSKKFKKGENVVKIVASSKKLTAFLNKKGMPIGNKLESNLRIPDWITEKPVYERAFIRGLFDTDGCIYLDTHKTIKKEYLHLGWTITSYADSLRSDIVAVLRKNGYSPTQRPSQKSVYLRRQKEIRRYFEEIGTSNSKHQNRYEKFYSDIARRGAPNG